MSCPDLGDTLFSINQFRRVMPEYLNCLEVYELIAVFLHPSLMVFCAKCPESIDRESFYYRQLCKISENLWSPWFNEWTFLSWDHQASSTRDRRLQFWLKTVQHMLSNDLVETQYKSNFDGASIVSMKTLDFFPLGSMRGLWLVVARGTTTFVRTSGMDSSWLWMICSSEKDFTRIKWRSSESRSCNFCKFAWKWFIWTLNK